jgi:hypothetical protein
MCFLSELLVEILAISPIKGYGLSRREGELASGAGYRGGFATTRFRTMEPITILNRCHRFRGIVYLHAHFGADKKHRSGRTTAQGFGRSLLALLFARRPAFVLVTTAALAGTRTAPQRRGTAGSKAASQSARGPSLKDGHLRESFGVLPRRALPKR